VDVFEALADPIRRDLMLRMATSPAPVVDLAARYGISRPAVSRHLRLLGEAGLTVAEDRGRERHYRLVPEGLEPVHRFLDAAAAASNKPAATRDLTTTPPGIPESVLDALDTEVRRTTRSRRRTGPKEAAG
jgi:DNA-binding transcriptional ArsR family regulator